MLRRLLTKIINSNKNLSLTFCLIIFSSAFSYSISEKTPFLDSLWWSIVTATTVGYGDSFPQNMLGRITARMASGLIVNNDAFTDIEHEELKRGIRKIVNHIEQQKETHVNPQ